MLNDNSDVSTGIYVRVSTEEQAREGFSIRAQTEKLKDYARIMGWNVYNVYSDEGISGKNITERPSINRMIKDILEKKVNTVLVFKVDRLTRSTKDLIELVEIFNANNCAFNSLMESIDTKTASGRMFLKIIGIFAEFERENIIERVSAAFERKVKEGYSLCSLTPSYGFDRANGQKIQTVNEEEAQIVKQVFSMYVNSNRSMSQIACELNTRGVKTKMNSVWTGKTIKVMLTNPNYVGKVRYCVNDENRYFEAEGHHEAIITQDIYDKAQVKLSKIVQKHRTKRPKENNYFAGTLYCGVCGRKLSTHGNNKKLNDGSVNFIAQYRCTNRMHKACTAKDMSHKKVEEAFLQYIDNIEDLNISDEINLQSQTVVENNAKLQTEYQNRLSQLEQKEKEIMKLYISEKIDFDEYTKMGKIIAKEMKKLKIELDNLEVDTTEPPTVTKSDIITNIKENWELLTKSEKMEFLHNYIEKIVIINEEQANSHIGKVKIKKMSFYNE